MNDFAVHGIANPSLESDVLTFGGLSLQQENNSLEKGQHQRCSAIYHPVRIVRIPL